MNANLAAALVLLVDDYAAEATMTADSRQRRLIRDGQAQLAAILDGVVTGRITDDEASAWLDAGRLTLARYRHSRAFVSDLIERIRTSRT